MRRTELTRPMKPMRTAILPASLVTLVTLGALGIFAGCSGDAGGKTEPLEYDDLTPLRAYDTSGALVPRGGWCEAISVRVVDAVLPPRTGDLTVDSWVNGDRIRVGGSKDVAHEYGCRWSDSQGNEVAAWVAAPPITAERAAALANSLTAAPGCRSVKGEGDFGEQSASALCDTTAVYAARFGDAWLGCSLTQPDLADGSAGVEEATKRTGTWCAAVLDAVRTDTAG